MQPAGTEVRRLHSSIDSGARKLNLAVKRIRDVVEQIADVKSL
jgi:hypothetical protein